MLLFRKVANTATSGGIHRPESLFLNKEMDSLLGLLNNQFSIQQIMSLRAKKKPFRFRQGMEKRSAKNRPRESKYCTYIACGMESGGPGTKQCVMLTCKGARASQRKVPQGH